MIILSKTKYLFFLLFVLGTYLTFNCSTKYVERPLTLGSISVLSTPYGANIFLDNQDTGKLTPDTLLDVPTGMHQVSVSKAGYVSSPASEVVEVSENQTVSVFFTLFDINYGFLYVSSTPDSARIIIDTNFTGEHTPHLFLNDVPVGTHIVSVSKDGHSTNLPSKYVVNIAPTDTVQLNFGLTLATEGIYEGNLAWDFDLLDILNNRIILSNYRGYVAIIFLWAKDCYYCMQELPYIQAIYEEYKADTVKVFGINYADDLSNIVQIRDAQNLSFTLLIGVGNSVVHDHYYSADNYKTPKTMILNRNGTVYCYKLGYNKNEDPTNFRNKLNELLGK